MGSPLSPIVADLVMQRLERSALMLFRDNVLFYYQYVDLYATVSVSKILFSARSIRSILVYNLSWNSEIIR